MRRPTICLRVTPQSELFVFVLCWAQIEELSSTFVYINRLNCDETIMNHNLRVLYSERWTNIILDNSSSIRIYKNSNLTFELICTKQCIIQCSIDISMILENILTVMSVVEKKFLKLNDPRDVMISCRSPSRVERMEKHEAQKQHGKHISKQ